MLSIVFVYVILPRFVLEIQNILEQPLNSIHIDLSLQVLLGA